MTDSTDPTHSTCVAPVHQYAPRVLEVLARHGLRPKPETPLQLARDHVNDLYRYELRGLRMRLVRGDIPKAGYSGHVVALRRKYLLLSIPVQLWTR